jgi:hypothetical protein
MDKRDYVLALLRCARLRAELIRNEFDAVGIALRDGMITPAQALCVLSENGLLDWIRTDGIEVVKIMQEENRAGTRRGNSQGVTGGPAGGNREVKGGDPDRQAADRVAGGNGVGQNGSLLRDMREGAEKGREGVVYGPGVIIGRSNG